jgi:hypothetical protein
VTVSHYPASATENCEDPAQSKRGFEEVLLQTALSSLAVFWRCFFFFFGPYRREFIRSLFSPCTHFRGSAVCPALVKDLFWRGLSHLYSDITHTSTFKDNTRFPPPARLVGRRYALGYHYPSREYSIEVNWSGIPLFPSPIVTAPAHHVRYRWLSPCARCEGIQADGLENGQAMSASWSRLVGVLYSQQNW